ncbi:hypothetical protein FRX31_005262 [Thalictrum thalictroides]|uniref:Transmembrane protein n=1 Tax=Thalictrum thalictroides TaxID=46969 RepID=A0A7J6X653_THATH|nr:hypothetical protein FRX31_005262 [Thalictrum thalictroides]
MASLSFNASVLALMAIVFASFIFIGGAQTADAPTPPPASGSASVSPLLARTGASVFNRFFNPFLHQKPNSSHNLLSQSSNISPNLFPVLSKIQPSLHLHENNADIVNSDNISESLV